MASRSPVGRLFPIDRPRFVDALRVAREVVGNEFEVTGMSLDQRIGNYLLVSDAGVLWISGTEASPEPRVIGTVRDSEDKVRERLARVAVDVIA